MTRNGFVSLSMILLLFVGCKSNRNSSEKNIDSLIINDKDSIWGKLGLRKEEWKKILEEYSGDSILTAYCDQQKEVVSKFTNIFSQHIIDSNLIVSMSKIKCNKIDFLTYRKLAYDVQKWDFDYEQLIKFKDDKRACSKVLTVLDHSLGSGVDLSYIDSIPLSTVSLEVLRFLNSKILGYYPCEIEYTYSQIESNHSLHPKKWEIKRKD